jgi:zinc D-Ala-D-Ala dipeptidase
MNEGKFLKYPFLILLMSLSAMADRHPGFTSLRQNCPGIILQMDYATTENFTGSVVDGYLAKEAYLANEPASALCAVQKEALAKGFCLKIFDSYRPVKAVSFFQKWARLPEENFHLKETYYPKFTRLELFERGFIAKRSSHSRGSAVDLTLFDLRTNTDVDMGGRFDYFDEVSSTESSRVGAEQLKNRRFLKQLMEKHGFKNFSQEWWHYSFKSEPFPGEYFDFDVI